MWPLTFFFFGNWVPIFTKWEQLGTSVSFVVNFGWELTFVANVTSNPRVLSVILEFKPQSNTCWWSWRENEIPMNTKLSLPKLIPPFSSQKPRARRQWERLFFFSLRSYKTCVRKIRRHLDGFGWKRRTMSILRDPGGVPPEYGECK